MAALAGRRAVGGVIASEAKQSMLRWAKLDCFVAALLAMTAVVSTADNTDADSLARNSLAAPRSRPAAHNIAAGPARRTSGDSRAARDSGRRSKSHRPDRCSRPPAPAARSGAAAA